MKRFRKLLLGSGIALALTAAFAFKAEKQDYTIVGIANPLHPYECVTGYDAEGDCSTVNNGPQCTAYYSDTYPACPAYAEEYPECTYPVYQESN